MVALSNAHPDISEESSQAHTECSFAEARLEDLDAHGCFPLPSSSLLPPHYPRLHHLQRKDLDSTEGDESPPLSAVSVCAVLMI